MLKILRRKTPKCLICSVDKVEDGSIITDFKTTITAISQADADISMHHRERELQLLQEIGYCKHMILQYEEEIRELKSQVEMWKKKKTPFVFR